MARNRQTALRPESSPEPEAALSHRPAIQLPAQGHSDEAGCDHDTDQGTEQQSGGLVLFDVAVIKSVKRSAHPGSDQFSNAGGAHSNQPVACLKDPRAIDENQP